MMSRLFVDAPGPAAAGLSAAARAGGDRCPGALRLHPADDGGLARLRVPGGLLSASELRALVDATVDLGDGDLHLTARGNVEIRGVADGDDLARRLTAAGLLPSATHERMRNIVATPLAGLDGRGNAGPAGLADLVQALDAALVADAVLARLSGRFLFGLDDGRGDVLALGPDIAFALVDPELAHLIIAGRATGLMLAATDLPLAAAVAARAFLGALDSRGMRAWRVKELGIYSEPVRTAMADAVGSALRVRRLPLPAPPDITGGAGPRPGLVADPSGTPVAVSALLPLGAAASGAWRDLADLADGGDDAEGGDGYVRTTPWRGVVVGGLAPAEAATGLVLLRDAGLIVSPDDPWVGVSACTGRPGCAKSHADVRAHAAAYVTTLGSAPGPTAPPVHLSGCDRRCGHPVRPHIEAVATGDGYRTGRFPDDQTATDVPTSALAAQLQARRMT